jgi:preprotein translocase subunit SecD
MQNQYPLWKNLLLIGLFLFGVIYALPNLFDQDPSVQISTTSTSDSAQVKINAQTMDSVKQALQDAQLKYLAAEESPDKLLIRFADTDLQLKARDVIKATLGDDYTVALNIASRTPRWLTALGANPMKLGLDLRGGVRFLLEVDANALLKAREDGEVRSISDTLRQANIRYSGVERLRPHGLVIKFRDTATLEQASSEIKYRLVDYTFTKIDNNGEHKLQLVMSDKAMLQIANDALEKTMNTLRKRVNELGVSEAIVQRQGANRVSVEFPGIQDTTRAKEIIGKTATLRFQMVDVDHDAESVAMGGELPFGTKLYSYEERHVLLKDQAILQGNSITYAATSLSQDGRPAVTVHLGGGGESMFHRVTAENVGKPMAVVYVDTKPEQRIVDGKVVNSSRLEERVISVATIQSALGNNFEITGLGSKKYASDLALLLRSGSLTVPMMIVEEKTVGASAGKANIDKGFVSIVIGFVFVVLFMIIYYYFFGIVSNIALLVNLVFMVAILSLLGATLTLPGIAGIVLTVGTAVDAHILIYERIREELRNGVSPQASIFSSYERVFTTIVDSNVTNLIVAVVLFALGSGAVQGFAVTLVVGLLTSMFTAILYTRAVVNFTYGKRNIKKLAIGI